MLSIRCFFASCILTLTPTAVMADDQLQVDAKEKTKIFGIASADSCIAGHNPFSAGTTDRIRLLAEKTITEYIQAYISGNVIEIKMAFTKKKHISGWDGETFANYAVVTGWSYNGMKGDVPSISDPIANSFQVIGGDISKNMHMEEFLVAGSKLTAMGRWRLVDPQKPERILGRYRAYFIRENSIGGQAWKLAQLDLQSAEAAPLEVKQFCVQPGDVERNNERMKSAKKK